MDFNLSEEQAMLQKMVSDIAKNEFAETAKEIDKSHRFPKENIEIMAQAGLLGVTIDEKYGGGAMDYICYSIVVEELSKICATTGTIMSAHLSLILRCGISIRNSSPPIRDIMVSGWSLVISRAQALSFSARRISRKSPLSCP